MKSVIKAVIAVVILAGVAGAAELNADARGLLTELNAVKAEAPKAEIASLTWTVKEVAGVVTAEGEGVPAVRVEYRGMTDYTATVDGKPVEFFSEHGGYAVKCGADYLTMKQGKMLGRINGNVVLDQGSHNGSPERIETLVGESVLVVKGDKRILTGSLDPDAVKFVAYLNAFGIYVNKVMAGK